MFEDTGNDALTPEETRSAFDGIETALHSVTDALVLLNETLPQLAPRDEVDAQVSLVMAEARAMESRFVKDRRRTRWLVAVGAVLVAVTMTLTLSIRAQQETQENLARENKELNAQIKDCTSPEGACFKANRVSLAALVQNVTDAVAVKNQEQLNVALETALAETQASDVELRKLLCDVARLHEGPLPQQCL